MMNQVTGGSSGSCLTSNLDGIAVFIIEVESAKSLLPCGCRKVRAGANDDARLLPSGSQDNPDRGGASNTSPNRQEPMAEALDLS